jgi:hypothetical protein
MSARTKVQYPIFLEFTHHAKDEYWKLLYEDMAFGKFPAGTFVQNNHFCCFSKGKEFSVALTPKNFSVFTQVHSLLSNDLGIRSEKEKNVMKENVLLSQTAKDPKRLIKDISLTSFIIKKGGAFRLPDHIICKLFSLFIVGFMFKTLLLKDVVFCGNEIQDIRGFSFAEKKVRISKSILELKKPSPLCDTRNDPRLLSGYWSKYMHNLTCTPHSAQPTGF